MKFILSVLVDIVTFVLLLFFVSPMHHIFVAKFTVSVKFNCCSISHRLFYCHIFPRKI